MPEIIEEREDFNNLAQAWASDNDLYGKIIPAATGEAPPSILKRLESFSDSFIFTYASSEQPKRQINHLGNELVAMFDYGITKRLLFRGAIAHGDFCQGSRSLVGPAVDEAYEWSDQANWAGILCSPSAREFIDQQYSRDALELSGDFGRWEVPIKGRPPLDTWVVWWPRTGKRNAIKKIFLEPPVSSDVELKMAATLKFYDWATGLFPVGVKGEP